MYRLGTGCVRLRGFRHRGGVADDAIVAEAEPRSLLRNRDRGAAEVTIESSTTSPRCLKPRSLTQPVPNWLR